MAEPLSEKVLVQIGKAEELYHRLVLVAAPSGSGKTAALRHVATRTGAPLLNVNLEISRRLLDLTERQRALELPKVLEEVVGRHEPLVLLDNIEILFDVTLKQDPLRLLQGVSRNRTVVAAWNGTLENDYLTYATPEHPEYRRCPRREMVVVCPEVMA
jgi:hypothetical protein